MTSPATEPRGHAFELRLALRYLTTTRREGPVALVTLLCTGGVFVGVVALVVALALMSGLQGDIRQRLLASNPHVIVRPSSGGGYADAEVREIERVAAGWPGVVAVAPFRSDWGILRSRLVPSGLPAQIKAVDPASEDRATGLGWQTSAMGWKRLVEDAAREVEPAPAGDDEAPLSFEELAPDEPPAALLGEGLARDLGVVPGDVVHLVVPGVDLSATGPAFGKSRALRVAGLLATGLHEYDQTWAVTTLARSPVGGARVEGIQLALADPLEAAALADELSDALGADHLVTDWTTTFSRLFAAFRWEKLIMFIALGLIGMVAGFNIFTILTLNVIARIADIGILGALGASAGMVMRVFLWMGLLLGGLGTATGLVAGGLAATLLDAHELVALDPTVYLVSHVPFRVQPRDLAMVGAAMLVVSLVATLLPARAAARLDPVVALRSA